MAHALRSVLWLVPSLCKILKISLGKEYNYEIPWPTTKFTSDNLLRIDKQLYEYVNDNCMGMGKLSSWLVRVGIGVSTRLV